ncbi:MAG TPA: hypothetical protein VKA36_05270, partial [Solirubrobacterales bacterium]|nr:hypothetical protein [Solirubrobacterales bacterium]
VGNVKRLDRPADDEIGTIVIDGEARGERRKVRVQFNDADYHRALSAHDKRRAVSVVGTLQKAGRKWILLDPRELSIIES